MNPQGHQDFHSSTTYESLTSRRKLALLKALLPIMACVTAVFTFINLSRGVYALAVVEASLGAVYLVMYALLCRREQYLRVMSWIFAVSCALLGLFAAGISGTHSSVFVWPVVIYFLLLFLLGLRGGLLLCIPFFIAVMGLLLGKYGADSESWPLVATANLCALNLAALFFAIFYEKTRAATEEALLSAHREMEALSNRDGLTGLFNRRYFDNALEIEWRRMQRSNQPLSLIMADIDFFKHYNDNYGHQAGDCCLRGLAEAVGDSFTRASDITARYGGEEFAVVLPNTDLAGAAKMAERVRKRVEGLELEHLGSIGSRKVTMSLGVASMVPSNKASPDALVAAADAALYTSKQQGRNRVTFA